MQKLKVHKQKYKIPLNRNLANLVPLYLNLTLYSNKVLEIKNDVADLKRLRERFYEAIHQGFVFNVRYAIFDACFTVIIRCRMGMYIARQPNLLTLDVTMLF